jgi:two-component system cell cycle response regulator
MSGPSTSKTILCIDGDDCVLEYEKELLERRGYTVLAAVSARQGLQIAADSPVAAVIIDYHMPEMNGHEVAMAIKRLKPETLIVMISSDPEILEHVINTVDAFIPKHDAPTRLLPVLTRICDARFAGFPENTRMPA